jgi:predicted AlkP superfamily pyrophosphatase or phosphodiesterase
MIRTSSRAVALVLTLVAGACTGSDEPNRRTDPPPGSPTLQEMAQRLGSDVVEHLRRGYYPGRSTDIMFVPVPGTTVVRWSGKGLGTDLADPRTTHPTPWAYHQRVPITLYGPGYVRSGEHVQRSVDVTDIEPTFAELMGFDFQAPAGEPLEEALLPAGRRSGQPKVVVLVAYDGGGWNLLEEWPDAWPFQRRLMEQGTTYLNATIGSAPSVTSAIHANMGTAAYPEDHGMPEITARLPDGSVGDIFLDNVDPRFLEVPTVADRWDLQQDNLPWIGTLAYESWHLGMMSHGAQYPGGDRDVGVIWEPEPAPGEFFTNERFYALPGTLPGEHDLEERLRALDADDGAIDDTWMGWALTDPKVIPATPAFVEHQGEALVQMVEDEPIGEDAVTDMLFLELKPTDFGGHLWNMVAPEEEFVLRAQDRVLRDLVKALDRKVGPNNYVLALTADHGQTPKPETVGGLRVHPDLVGRRVNRYFGVDVVQKVTPSGMFIDRLAAEQARISLEAIARFVGTHRYGDGLPADADRSAIPAEDLQRRVFAGALPATFFDDLTPGEVAGFGDGEYAEGNLSQPAIRPQDFGLS